MHARRCSSLASARAASRACGAAPRGATVYATDEKAPRELARRDRAIEAPGVPFVAPSELDAVAGK